MGGSFISIIFSYHTSSLCNSAAAGIAAQQLKNILDQLRGEVPRIKAGNLCQALPGFSGSLENDISGLPVIVTLQEVTINLLSCQQLTTLWTAGKPSLPSWRARNGSGPQALSAGNGGRHDTEQTASQNSRHSAEAASQEERPMVQQMPLACIGDSVVTLPEVPRVPPGEMHCHHVQQPGHSLDEWPTNSLWGAIAG